MSAVQYVLTAGTVGFPHILNPHLANAWARYAASDAFDPARLSSLTDAQQEALVVGCYQALANTFLALNVRPYGWKFYRDQWERVLGRIDVNNLSWSGGAWDQHFTNAWVDGGGDITGLQSSYILEMGPDGEDRQRVQLQNNGGLLRFAAPRPPSDGFVVQSRLGWARETGTAPSARLQIVPSWFAYLEVARAIATELTIQTSSELGVKELIKQMRSDVEAKNFATAWGIGVPVTDLPGRAELMRRESVQRDRDTAHGVAGTMVGIAAAVSAIPGGIIAGAVIGVVALVVELLANFIGMAAQWQRDVFYRREPVFEAFRFNDELVNLAAHSWPAPPPGWTDDGRLYGVPGYWHIPVLTDVFFPANFPPPPADAPPVVAPPAPGGGGGLTAGIVVGSLLLAGGVAAAVAVKEKSR